MINYSKEDLPLSVSEFFLCLKIPNQLDRLD